MNRRVSFGRDQVWATARHPARRFGRSLLLPLLAAGSLALLFAALVHFVLLNRRDSRFEPQGRIDLTEPAPATASATTGDGAGPDPDPAAPPPLVVAIAPVISPERSIQLYDGFVRWLAARVRRTPVLVHRDTYEQVNDLVRLRRCDLAFACTYAFVRGERTFGMQLLAAPVVGGAETYHSLLIVPAASKAESLFDLAGRRFASADLLSCSGWLYPANWLIEHGQAPESFFSDHVLTGSHDRSLEAVASAYVDGAAVDSLVYEQMVRDDPPLAGLVRILQKSPAFGMPPLVVHPRMDALLREQVQAALLAMHEDPAGREALSRVGIDRFFLPDPRIYDSVRRAADAWESR